MTPSGDFNDSLDSSHNINKMDEENIVIFHDKSKIEKFFTELPALQNYFFI